MILVYGGMARFRWVISTSQFYTLLGLVTAAGAVQQPEGKGQKHVNTAQSQNS